MVQNELGLNITSAKKLHNECKIPVHRNLKTSPNLEVRRLYEITNTKHVNSDSITDEIGTVGPEK